MSLIVQFRKQAVQNNYQTHLQGKPVFEDHDFIKILIPADRNLIIDTKVTAEHKEKFSEEWENYQKTGMVAQTGYPLDEWTSVTRSQVELLKYSNIFTVEQLASLSDAGVQSLGMGALDLRAKAQSFMERSSETKDLNKLSDTMEELRSRIRELEEEKIKDKKIKSKGKSALADQIDGMMEEIDILDEKKTALSE